MSAPMTRPTTADDQTVAVASATSTKSIAPGRRRLTRRAALRLLALGTSAALIAACGNQPAAPAQPPAGSGPAPGSTAGAAPPIATGAGARPTAETVGQPRSGGTLRQGFLGDLSTIDGH